MSGSHTDTEHRISLFQAIDETLDHDDLKRLSYCTNPDISEEESELLLKELFYKANPSWTPKMVDLFNNLDPNRRLLVANAENKIMSQIPDADFNSEQMEEERTNPSSSPKNKGKQSVKRGTCPYGCGDKNVKLRIDDTPYAEHEKVCPNAPEQVKLKYVKPSGDNDDNEDNKKEKKDKKDKKKKKENKPSSSNANNSDDDNEDNKKEKKKKNKKNKKSSSSNQYDNDAEPLDPPITFHDGSDDEDDDEDNKNKEKPQITFHDRSDDEDDEDDDEN